MASVAQGVFKGGLPWGMVAIGAGIGAVIIGVDEWNTGLGGMPRQGIAPIVALGRSLLAARRHSHESIILPLLVLEFRDLFPELAQVSAAPVEQLHKSPHLGLIGGE